MLQTIKSKIRTAKVEDFSEYYMRYVCEVQDSNIEMELSYLLRRNMLSIESMDALIQDTFERLGLNDHCGEITSIL